MTADLRRLVKKLWRCSKYPSLWTRQRNYKKKPLKTECLCREGYISPQCSAYLETLVTPLCMWGPMGDVITQVKYLGVILDPKLNWQLHLDAKCSKAIVTFYQLRGSIGKTWGITPKITRWMYTAVIRPSLSYASLVWWPQVYKKPQEESWNIYNVLPAYTLLVLYAPHLQIL